MICKPAVTGAQNPRDTGQFGRGVKWPGPPDLPGEKNDSFGAAVNFAVARGDAHFSQQILRRQGEKGLDSRILQTGKAEAALFKGAMKAAGERGTDAAIAVEENPAAAGMPSFCISHF